MKLTNLVAVVGNTFTETLRQPIYGIVIAATIICLIFAHTLTMFTLSDDDKLLIDVGLSTLLVAGLFLAAFASSYAVTEEIERKTTLTVLSKAISRPTFILGKFRRRPAGTVYSVAVFVHHSSARRYGTRQR